MQGASLVLTSYQASLTRAMDIVSNNIANVTTTGFKREAIAFDSYVSRPTPRDNFTFAIDQGSYRDIAPGSSIITGNPLDVSIQGKGYIPIETEKGIQYTRGGAFQLNHEGELVTANGDRVLGDGNQVLAFPQNAQEIIISSDGIISASAGNGAQAVQVGKLTLVGFEDEQELIPVGNSLYTTEQIPQPIADGSFVQGAIEQSNVQAIKEMTRMIDISRAYMRVARMLETEHERQSKAIQRLGRASA